uniref:Uncharacterized protein n=1 Tax=Mycena chlorophos TaxID=658473 RepID=A0ABQ0M3X2_MYCCL|nr:predicted protein [Mycena chlorophos]
MSTRRNKTAVRWSKPWATYFVGQRCFQARCTITQDLKKRVRDCESLQANGKQLKTTKTLSEFERMEAVNRTLQCRRP